MKFLVKAFNPNYTRKQRAARRKAWRALHASEGVGGGIILKSNEGRILLLRRAWGDEGGGTWCPPGGRKNKGEDNYRAALRETFEEAGYACVVPLTELVTRNGFTNYTADIGDEFIPTLSPEHVEYRWVSALSEVELYPPFQDALEHCK